MIIASGDGEAVPHLRRRNPMTTISDHSPSGLRVRWEESVWPGETVREDGAAILED